MKIEFQDHIDDYLQGRMSEEERQAFEKDVESDNELREQLAFTEDVQHVMKSRNDKFCRMKEWENENMHRDKKNASSAMKHVSGLRIAYWFSGIAAILIVGVFVFTTYKFPENESTYNMISQSDKDDVSFGRIEGNYQAAESSLNNKDYTKTLAMLEKKEADIKFERMLLMRELDTRGESRENIEDKLKLLSVKLQRLQFEKAQVLIELNRHEEAMILLDEIRHSESEYKEQADSLYHLLQK